MKCGICGKEMIKLADGVNYGCDYCNIQTLLYRPNTGMPIDRSQQYIDMLNKESSELLIDSLAEKDKKIAELQQQLKSQPAEIVEKIKAYYETPIYDRPEAHTKVSVLFSRLDTILKEYQKYEDNKDEK